jgi:hypothetical protein
LNRQNRYDQLDPFTVKVINSEARNLIGTYAFTEADFHDLQQDLHLHVRRRMAILKILLSIDQEFFSKNTTSPLEPDGAHNKREVAFKIARI